MTTGNLEFFSAIEIANEDARTSAFVDFVERFNAFGTSTRKFTLQVGRQPVPVFVNEFWTSKQRAANRIHEVSYRACFKPQLPRFFIESLTEPGDCVLDPFMGRGTTLVEAVLMGRTALGCDINPLSRIICEPRLNPPRLEEVARRLEQLDLTFGETLPEGLETFYHRDTLKELCALRQYLIEKGDVKDLIDNWIQMAATNRLTGHSKGFFSVYTLPPNQAVTVDRQRLINEKRNQKPDYRDVKQLILRKSRSLLSQIDTAERECFHNHGRKSRIFIGSSDALTGIRTGSVNLVVTSPPFLDVVNYASDNWLRCWFNGIDSKSIPISIHRKVGDWSAAMTRTFIQLKKLLRKGGYVAFEVGEVRGGSIRLEDHVIPSAEKAGLVPILVLVNDQQFTKTSNCWGVSNLQKGTNTNRIVLLKKV